MRIAHRHLYCTASHHLCNRANSPAVMSSRLCKYAEGASFPFQVESLEDGVDDPVHGLHVDEADHGPCSAADFDETALDDVGGALLAPQVLGESEKTSHFSQGSIWW